LIGELRDTLPPAIDFVWASALLMLPLYVLFAQALTNLFRLIRRQRVYLRWACAVLLAVWVIPADNFSYARHQAYFAATMFMKPEDKPLRVQELLREQRQRSELQGIADWLKDTDNTPIQSLVVHDNIKIRIRARRGILASSQDVRFYYYLAPWRLEEWSFLVETMKDLLRPPAGAHASGLQLKHFVDRLEGRSEYADVRQWYVILKKGDLPGDPGPIQPVTSPQWGKHYMLYRVR